MLLREIPLNKTQTVYPFPWLQAREQNNNAPLDTGLLDIDVSNKFVYSGGLLIYFQPSGNWIVVAETKYPFSPKGWIVRNWEYWNKAINNADSIIKNEEMRELIDFQDY